MGVSGKKKNTVKPNMKVNAPRVTNMIRQPEREELELICWNPYDAAPPMI